MRFDIGKAQDAAKMYNSRNPNVNTAVWAHNCAEHLPGAIDLIEQQDAEIERLRALRSDILTTINRPKTTSDKGLLLYIRAEVDYNIRQATQIGDLEAEIEMLQADAEQHERVIEARSEVIDQQAVKIKELEEEIERLTKPNASDDWGNPIVLSVSGGVYDPPVAKGKIGPDAETAHHECQECDDEFCDEDEYPKSQCWQITEGRKDALAQCIFELEDIMDDRPFFREEIDVLRAMIEEAK